MRKEKWTYSGASPKIVDVLLSFIWINMGKYVRFYPSYFNYHCPLFSINLHKNAYWRLANRSELCVWFNQAVSSASRQGCLPLLHHVLSMHFDWVITHWCTVNGCKSALRFGRSEWVYLNHQMCPFLRKFVFCKLPVSSISRENSHIKWRVNVKNWITDTCEILTL